MHTGKHTEHLPYFRNSIPSHDHRITLAKQHFRKAFTICQRQIRISFEARVLWYIIDGRAINLQASIHPSTRQQGPASIKSLRNWKILQYLFIFPNLSSHISSLSSKPYHGVEFPATQAESRRNNSARLLWNFLAPVSASRSIFVRLAELSSHYF